MDNKKGQVQTCDLNELLGVSREEFHTLKIRIVHSGLEKSAVVKSNGALADNPSAVPATNVESHKHLNACTYILTGKTVTQIKYKINLRCLTVFFTGNGCGRGESSVECRR